MPKPNPTTRRQFLAGAASTVVGAAFAARSSASRVQKTLPKRIILGKGDHAYECWHDWLLPPANLLWGDTHGVAQDSHGRIYIAHTVREHSPSSNTIVVYDHNGKYITSWGSQWVGGAHGLDLRREGREEFLYHTDIAHRVYAKTSLAGEVIWQKGLPTESGVYGPNDPFIPTNTAFAPNGDFYVADGYGSNWIHQFALNGDYIRTFGGTGTELGKFRTPHGLMLDSRKKPYSLVVADRANRRLQYFTLDGKVISQLTNGMREPCHFHTRGELMVVPDLDSVVTILDGTNQVLEQLGDGFPTNLTDAPRSQFIPGKFIHPHSAKFLHNGDILVVEWVTHGRITLLKRVNA